IELNLVCVHDIMWVSMVLFKHSLQQHYAALTLIVCKVEWLRMYATGYYIALHAIITDSLS
ncbi:MAG: hypothetical protein MPL62_18270, partial [Alphaproteobacteria bacterium]|nr:hypothetical protein [Alphaproteobacteria bacterium]